MKKKDTIIHIKLDSNEAIESRRDVLNTEVDIIKIAQNIKNYRAQRLKELQFKIILLKKLKEAQSDLRKIKTLLPKLEIPKILKKHEEEMHKEIEIKELRPIDEVKEEKIPKKEKKSKKEIKEKIKPVENSLESQLKQIQEKLNSLG